MMNIRKQIAFNKEFKNRMTEDSLKIYRGTFRLYKFSVLWAS